jgi:N-acetyl-gamma-glutamyl-phosphate reductase
MHIYSEVKNTVNSSSLDNNPKTRVAPSSLNVAIIGARGYSGLELYRGLLNHPNVITISLGLNESQFNIDSLIPEKILKPVQIKPVADLIKEAANYDLFFLATPAEISMELTPQLLKNKTRVIDLSGAFRLHEKSSYLRWYNFEHHCADLLKISQYGLSPFHNSLNKDLTPLIANPGCYATSVLMALVPLLKANLIDPKFIVIDAKSGTTGGGKKASENLLFSEVDNDCTPYRIGKHQHFPEICEQIFKLTGQQINPMFSTTLIPVRRGIITGIYTQLKTGVSSSDIETVYINAYEQYPLVNVAKSEIAPHLLSLKRVVGSARTHISYTLDETTQSLNEEPVRKLYIYSCIDNLMKGAATQAIENMNHLWSWPAETGLISREGIL